LSAPLADALTEKRNGKRAEAAELLGISFLKELEDGQKVHAKIVIKIHDLDTVNQSRIKMLLQLGDESQIETIMSYTDVCNMVESQIDEEINDPTKQWTYKGIIRHEGPTNPSDPMYKGSKYNLKVQWEDGSVTYEPLGIIGKDDLISCAQYAHEQNLLNVDGWKFLKWHYKSHKKVA